MVSSNDVTFASLQLPPLLEREWRWLAARYKAPASLRKLAIWAIAITAGLALLDHYVHFRNPGELLFRALLALAVLCLLNSGYGVGFGLAEHRRNRTLGLLFLTQTRPRDLFLYLIGARIGAAFYVALALLPCFAVSLLYGGVDWQRCVAGFLFIILEVIFLVAFEFVGAAVTADAGFAGLISKTTRAILLFWPWIIDRVTQVLTGHPLPRSIYRFTPLHAALDIWEGFINRAGFVDFLLTCLYVSALSLGALLISAWILSHTWREEDHPLQKLRLVRRLRERFRRATRAWAAALRPELERNPLLWQAAYDQRSVRIAWLVLLVLFGLWLAGLGSFGKAWAVPAIFYLAIAAFIYSVRLQMLLRVAARFSDARQNSYFDFLLASRHSPEQIVDAETRGLFLQFRTIAWCVRFLTVAFLIVPLFTRAWNQVALAEHAAISVVLLWFSILRPRPAIAQTMWISLNTAAGASAVFQRSSFPIFSFGWQFYRIISKGIAGLATFPTGHGPSAVVTLIVGAAVAIAMMVNKVYGKSRERKLIENFRAVLESPLRSAEELAKSDFVSASKVN